MTEEPYRWLEAIGNRREYVREQLKGASPSFALSLPDGILLVGVGTGQSKVFEIFDRHALAGLGHPADIEKIRQAAIDAAHLEAFTRAPEDVSLRRLVSFGLGGQLKANFEQIYSAPFLVELVLAELGTAPEQDLLLRLHFDGTFKAQSGGVVVAASQPDAEGAAREWLRGRLEGTKNRAEAARLCLQAWWSILQQKSFGADAPPESEREAGWRALLGERVVEAGWLERHAARHARFQPLSPGELQLQDP